MKKISHNNTQASEVTTPLPREGLGGGVITFNTEGTVSMPDIDQQLIRRWVNDVAVSYGRRVGEINYIFVDDERILEVNRQFLGHDYYTDIITFDYTQGRIISGDLYISLDTVRSNEEEIRGKEQGARGKEQGTRSKELHRVIIHGVLHLCGINDKGPGEREIMEACEDKALAKLNFKN